MDWIPQRRWRDLAAPIGPSEVRRTERVLAQVRASLAAAGFIAVLMYPIQSLWVYCLLLTYVIHSFSVMMALKLNKRLSSAFRVLIYSADLMWPALIFAFPMGRNLFFLFFVFVLAAAALRWGLWETVGTAAGSLILLWLESVVLRQGLLAHLGSFFARYHWPELGIDLRELAPKKLIILSFCLLLMGWLLGYLAEHHKFLRAELERASIARKLHDGVLSSLFGLGMRLHVLSESLEGPAAQDARQIRDILQEEGRKLRELMVRVKPLDVDAKSLRPHLIERAQRFERETGIRVRFVSDSSVVDLERSICDIVVRTVDEALVNVRKHSCATDVWVRLGRKDGHWQLTIEDNGIGFPYSGHFSQSELKVSRKGPLVIIECVTSIGGDLTLESTAGRGSRLEITIPAKRELLEKIKHFKLGLGSPDDDVADETGAVKTPKSPNLNSGSAAASWLARNLRFLNLLHRRA
jgi:signal transduction histidine kinase